MKQRSLGKRATALFLAALLLALAACSGGDGKNGTTAATMHLRRTQGTVAVSNGDGKSLPVLDDLNLYSGYGVGTRSASYAWIDLDEVKLTKLDQNSEISIEKEGKALDIEIISGSLFFNVTEPLKDDETMNIRTSTMLVGIRGTCGWVSDNGGLSRVYLLEGKVECSAEGQTVQVNAGEMAELTAGGKLVVEPFGDEDIPAFVREETEAGENPGSDRPDSPDPSAGSAAGYQIKHTDFDLSDLVQCYFERPVFDEITPGYKVINAFFEKLEADYLDDPNLVSVIGAAEEPNAPFTPYSYTYSAAVMAQGQSYVSIQLSLYWYSGGARPNHSTAHYTFNTQTGEQLGIQDFIDASEEDIFAIIKTELEALDGGTNYIWFDYLSRPLSQYDFYIENGAIHIFFDPGTIATVAAGMIDITLPALLKLD